MKSCPAGESLPDIDLRPEPGDWRERWPDNIHASTDIIILQRANRIGVRVSKVGHLTRFIVIDFVLNEPLKVHRPRNYISELFLFVHQVWKTLPNSYGKLGHR